MSNEKPKRAGFLVVGAVATTLFFSVIKAVLGGMIYATAVFFTKEGWERWKSKSKN
jgi:hypothetical protein